MVLIIGSRFGGTAIPKAISSVDIESLKGLSKGSKFLENTDKVSVTQLEVLKAIESNIPIFTFIDSRVMHDHLFYEKNKDKGFLDQLDFPSIENKNSANYIFEFINFLRLRTRNNSIIEFSKLSDIEDYLRKQWSALFQRLLYEQKFTKSESRRLEAFSEELKDIKSLILSGITPGQGKEVGRGVLKYRRLLDFLLGFRSNNISNILLEDITWEELVNKLEIKEIKIIETQPRIAYASVFIIMLDGTFYECRFSIHVINNLVKEWSNFRLLNGSVKQEIISALSENATNSIMPIMRYRDNQFTDYINAKELSKQMSIASTTTINPHTTLSEESETIDE